VKAWQVTAYGEPADALQLADVPEPEPGEHLVVRVHAAALNFPDVLLCRGTYQERPPLPFTPGIELTGEVVGAPPDCAFRPGDRVLGGTSPGAGGAYGEYAVMKVADAYAVPEGMPVEQAAALYLTYQTGHVGLHHRARLQAGETLLVTAGAGGVGSAAIQLGRAAGARVVATAGGPDKVQVCRDLGADYAIDYLADDFVALVKEWTGGRGVDVVYDAVGGDVFDAARRVVAWEGRLVVVGFTSGRIPAAPANHVLVKNYSVVGLHWGQYRTRNPEVVAAAHAELERLYGLGAIAPFVSQSFPFAELPAALTALASRRTVGKVVLQVADPVAAPSS